MRVRHKQQKGFTLVEVMIVVAIIGMLTAVAVPNFVRARALSQTNGCINNLRQLDGAVQQYALEAFLPSGTAVNLPDCAPYLMHNELPVCPAGGEYAVTDVDSHPTCNIANHEL